VTALASFAAWRVKKTLVHREPAGELKIIHYRRRDLAGGPSSAVLKINLPLRLVVRSILFDMGQVGQTALSV